MRGQLSWMRPTVFGVAVFCFLLPFASISCRGDLSGMDQMGAMMGGGTPPPQLADGKVNPSTTLTGLDLIKGKNNQDMAKEMVKGLPEGMVPSDQQNAGAGDGKDEKAGPYSWAIVAAACAAMGILLSFAAAPASAGASVALAILGAVSLVLLKSQVAADLKMDSSMSFGGISMGLNWLYGYIAAIALFALAIPVNVYATTALRETEPCGRRTPAVHIGVSTLHGPSGPAPYRPGPAAPGAGPPYGSAQRFDPLAQPAPLAPPPAPAAGQPDVIHVKCPNPACGQTLVVPARYRGTEGACKFCHTKIQVPA